MKKLLFITFFFIVSNFMFSQEIISDTLKSEPEKNIKRVIMKDLEEFTGEILSDDGREILLKSDKIGKIFLQKSMIKEIKPISFTQNISKKNKFSEDVEATTFTHYTFTSSSLYTPKGSNYSILNLYGPIIHFSLTNYLSIEFLSTWACSPLAFSTKIVLNPKSKNIHFSLNNMFGSTGFLYNGRGYGNLSLFTTTVGNRKNNFSIAGGYGLINNFVYKDKLVAGPILTIAAIKKLGITTSFIFDSMLSIRENYINTDIVNGYDVLGNPIYRTKTDYVFSALVMPGIRVQKTENKAFQVSLTGVVYKDGTSIKSFPIPMASWFFKL